MFRRITSAAASKEPSIRGGVFIVAVTIVMGWSCLGCSRHLMNVALRSPVSFRLDTPVRMTAEVTTQAPADHRASPISGRGLPYHGQGSIDAGPRSQIAVLDLDGVILNRNLTGLGSMGENPVALFREKLDAVAHDTRVGAVIVRINSPGGGVTASDIVRRDLIRFREQTGLPTVACLMDLGVGGAYYVATGCDGIIAHPTSVVGGVGVILNLYNLEDLMAQFNIVSSPIRAGSGVDAGSPARAMEPAERERLQEIADSFHDRFRDAVLESRPRFDGRVAEDLQGAVFTGLEALDKGLIDQVGYLDDAVSLASQLGSLGSSPRLILYRRENDRAQTAYDITPNLPLQNSFLPLSIPGLDRAQLPTFLYLWQIDPTLEKSGG